MDSSTLLYTSFFDALVRLPLLLVTLAGIVLAVVKYRQFPRVSLFTIVSLVISLVLTIVTAVIYRWLPLYFVSSQGLTAQQTAVIFQIVGFAANFIDAATLVLLLLAIYSQRGEQNRLRRHTQTL